MQQVQRTTASPSNSQTLAHPASAAQGSVIPTQGAFEQTQLNNINSASVQQNQPAGAIHNHYAFGQNSQASADPNHGGLVQSSQPTGIANDSLATNQVDGAGNTRPCPAALQNQGLGSQQSQSDAIDHSWTEFLSDLALEGMDLDVPVDDALHSNPLLDQQPPAQEPQSVQQPLAAEQPQAIEREPVQQQAAESDSHQQVSYDDDYDLFGDREQQQSEYEKMQALLEPVGRFNGEN